MTERALSPLNQTAAFSALQSLVHTAANVFFPPFVSNIELMWDLAEWERVFEWAGKHHRILIMDKCGVGLSDRTSEPSTLSDYVSDVISVMDAEGLRERGRNSCDHPSILWNFLQKNLSKWGFAPHCLEED